MLNHLKSLREYIDALQAIGEVQPIEQEVNLDLELAAIIRNSYEQKAPAPLFNTIKDIEPGFRVLGALALIVDKNGTNWGLFQLSNKYKGEFTADDERHFLKLVKLTSEALEVLWEVRNLRKAQVNL